MRKSILSKEFAVNGDHVPFDPQKETPAGTEGSYADLYFRKLNNFRFHFPGGKKGQVTYPGGYYREPASLSPEWDQTPSQQDIEKKLEAGTQKSRKRLLQSYKGFYQEIDEVLAELGISMRVIADAHTEAWMNNPSNDDAKWKLVWELLAPIYAALRQRGYNWHDLCG